MKSWEACWRIRYSLSLSLRLHTVIQSQGHSTWSLHTGSFGPPHTMMVSGKSNAYMVTEGFKSECSIGFDCCAISSMLIFEDT